MAAHLCYNLSMELQTPAGNLEKLKTAIRFGAGAVYCAAGPYSLRAPQTSFTLDELARGVCFAHEHGCRLFLAMNVFALDDDLDEMVAYLKEAVALGIDAVIISDPGVLYHIRKEGINTQVHLSTQANTTNSDSVRFWQQQGVREDFSDVPVQVAGLTGVTAISAGSLHSLALDSDQTARAWGRNNNGQLGDNTFSNRYTPVTVDNLTGVTKISAGGSHSLALKLDETAWAWGSNSAGELGNSTNDLALTPVQVVEITEATAVSAGIRFSLALQAGGAWAWGLNSSGQLGDCTAWSNTPVECQINLGGAVELLYGDINEDEKVDVADAVVLLRHVVGLDILDGEALERARVSPGGGAPGIGDVILILRYTGGLIPAFPVE